MGLGCWSRPACLRFWLPFVPFLSWLHSAGRASGTLILVRCGIWGRVLLGGEPPRGLSTHLRFLDAEHVVVVGTRSQLAHKNSGAVDGLYSHAKIFFTREDFFNFFPRFCLARSKFGGAEFASANFANAFQTRKLVASGGGGDVLVAA